MIQLGTFTRHVLVILTGSVAAQAVGILASPVLTRLYAPADFGVYALFLSMVTLLGTVACGRYEFGITLPAADRDGLSLLALSTVIAGGLSVLLLPVIAVFGRMGSAALKEPGLAPWLWVLPLAVFATGFAAAARYWLLRRKAFRIVAVNGFWRAFVASGANIAFGLAGWVAFGLIGGLLAGLFASAALLWVMIWRESGREIRALTWAEIRAQAVAYRKFPILSLGSAAVESGAAQVPVFFLSSIFGVAAPGFFSLAQRVANLPLALIASSVGDVFRQQASELYARDGQCQGLYDRTLRKLTVASVAPFILAAWLAPEVFALVFGEEWRESGMYVRYMTPAMALRFVSSPLSAMFYIAGRQDLDLIIQAVLLATLVAVFGWAGRSGSGWQAGQTIAAYSGVYSLKYLVELVLSRRFSRGARIS